MGEDEEPELEIIIVSPKKVSPLLNKTESPGCKELKKELNFEMVCHAVVGDVPAASSFPFTEK